MSKSPVEKRRSRTPWWAWLVIAVAVIVALWLIWPLITGEAGIGLVAPALAALLLPPRPAQDELEGDVERLRESYQSR